MQGFVSMSAHKNGGLKVILKSLEWCHIGNRYSPQPVFPPVLEEITAEDQQLLVFVQSDYSVEETHAFKH